VADDGFTREMSMAMYVKFEKYWGELRSKCVNGGGFISRS
jgi:hypothetical protein